MRHQQPANLFLPILPTGRKSLDDIQDDEMIPAILRERRKGTKSTILKAATGTGKTYTAAKFMIRAIREWNARILFLANRRNLVRQTAEELTEANIPFAIEMGQQFKARESMSSMFGEARVVIASKDTMRDRAGGTRLTGWDPLTFTDIITDECDLCEAPTFQDIYAHFPTAFHLGMSATVVRFDGKPLLKPQGTFENICYEYKYGDAVENGHLAEIVGINCHTGVDLKQVRMTRKGDCNVQDLRDAIIPLVKPLASECCRHIERKNLKKIIGFARDVETAKLFAEAFTSMGIQAKAVYGSAPKHKMSDSERDSIMRAHKEGDFPCLWTVDLLHRGHNDPPIDCGICARPTRSHALFTQMAGRMTRLAPGKTEGNMIGFRWRNKKKIVSTIDFLLADEPDPRLVKIARQLAAGRQDVKPRELLKEAKNILELDDVRQREEAERKLNISRAKEQYKYDEFKPFTAGEILGIAPVVRSLKDARLNPITDIQRDVLRDYGMKRTRGMSETEAQRVINECLDREFARRATPEQITLLIKRGIPAAEARQMNQDAARAIIDRPKPVSDKQVAWLIRQGYTPSAAQAMTNKQFGEVFARIKQGAYR